MSDTKSNKRMSFFLLLAAVALLFAYALVDKNEFSQEETAFDEPRKVLNTEAKINQHLQFTDRKRTLQLEGIDVKNKLERKDIGRNPTRLAAPGKHWEKGSSLEQQSKAVDFAKKYERKPIYDMSADEQIYVQQANSQFIEQYDRKERQVYIQEFLRKAAEDGYEVIINDDLEIVSVRPIR